MKKKIELLSWQNCHEVTDENETTRKITQDKFA